jgi:hypothetical protein
LADVSAGQQGGEFGAEERCRELLIAMQQSRRFQAFAVPRDRDKVPLIAIRVPQITIQIGCECGCPKCLPHGGHPCTPRPRPIGPGRCRGRR